MSIPLIQFAVTSLVSAVAPAAQAVGSVVSGGGLVGPGAPINLGGIAGGGAGSTIPAAGAAAEGATSAAVPVSAGAAPTASATPAGAVAPVEAAGAGLSPTGAAPATATPLSGKDIATIGLGTASVGLGAAQGVMAYQAGQEARRARATQAREIGAASERRIATARREAIRYESLLRARAGGAGVVFEGTPAILTEEASGVIAEEAEIIRMNAASAGRQLRREGRAAATAGNIGLGAGIGGGLVSGGSTALRIYG